MRALILALILFALCPVSFIGYVSATTPLEQAIFDIRNEPIEWQVTFDSDGNEIARISGDKDSVTAKPGIWYAGTTVLHNHPTPGLWEFSAQDYLFAQWHSIKRMIVVNRIGWKRYRVCSMERNSHYWDNAYIDFGHDKPLARFERTLSKIGYDKFWKQYAIERNYTYHCEDTK